MCPGGYPVSDKANWQSGFLPGAYQGTFVDPQHSQIEKLIENIRSSHASQETQRQQLDLVRQINSLHMVQRSDPRLEARIQSFELAFRMQMEASDAFDIQQETAHTREMYGESVHGRQTLIARRLLERGVRYVQLWHGAGQPWDHHGDIANNLKTQCGQLDQPLAAMLTDLKQRGMLDDTLVIWGGEFGRTSDSQGDKGRDHNPNGFTIWMAGAGVKGGFHYGATDPFGYKAVENVCNVHDFHATILHLLGLDHERLTFYYNGLERRLTDVEGVVVKDILA
jgi:uncharacterized protein (DUF1501 family)